MGPWQHRGCRGHRGSTSTGEEIGSSTGDDDEGSGSSTSTGSIEDASSTGDGSTSTGETSTGEDGSSSTSTGIPGEVCGDGLEGLYEACDDGTPGGGDGCSADCKRWDWFGIATDVPEVALVEWLPCWSSSYSEHALVENILEACTAKQIAFGCRLKGSPNFTVLAHAQKIRSSPRSLSTAGTTLCSTDPIGIGRTR
jgi:cysteine-rich repeat protein